MNTPICTFTCLYSRIPFLWSFISRLLTRWPGHWSLPMNPCILSHWATGPFIHNEWSGALYVALSTGKIFHPCYFSRPPLNVAQMHPHTKLIHLYTNLELLYGTFDRLYGNTHSPHPTPLLSPTIQLKVQARRETLVQLWWATWESRLSAHVPTLHFLVFFGYNSDVLFTSYNVLKEFCGFWKNPH